MKKILTFIIAITICVSGMAQGKSKGNGHAKKEGKDQKHVNKNESSDDRYDRDEDYRNRESSTGKYSKNIPSKVRSAFNHDYPNATNVSWTKSNGYWTATFPNGIYRRKVTYAANGQRVNSNGSTSRRSTTTQDGSVWDKILTRQ